MPTLIRDLTETDYPALLPLWQIFVSDTTVERITKNYNRIINNECYKTFVALVSDDNTDGISGEIAGFVTTALTYGIGVEGNYLQVIAISVKPEIQGMGIGKKLMQRVEEYAPEVDAFHVFLCSGMQRTDAHAFYERCGYIKGAYGFGKTL